MRVAFLTSILVFAFATCAAQTQQAAVTVTTVTIPDSPAAAQFDYPPDQPQPSTNFSNRNLSDEVRRQIARLHRGDAVCYTMRSYLFTPSVAGGAPRPAGYITCTPSNQLQMRQTKRPRARFVPQ